VGEVALIGVLEHGSHLLPSYKINKYHHFYTFT
jgi:hypothetical protein